MVEGNFVLSGLATPDQFMLQGSYDEQSEIASTTRKGDLKDGHSAFICTSVTKSCKMGYTELD